ncbi:glycosyl Hydrolase Family 88 [Terrimicrobium sacchariphilum]|uniref:Glycosyl Hydrolase Family 88 n=1 Tax=Terrimicrobium sacchariphilum TaxID=690879 RepID=A0A146G5R5_TERSA|nr:glycoside hydrolase family 88 protein [Terrimicrobium sacchariphilum]GAT33119.1 glycosyl Hydrolase Family 88 [Terrimicrobium sacchariphilum]
MITIRQDLTTASLAPKIKKLWDASAPKILSIDAAEKPGAATPVFTVQGKYTARGWTEWTQGFVYGSAILQYDATGDESFLTLGRDRTRERMAHHITHIGVHDHGFNNVSTYGNLLRLMVEGRIAFNQQEKDFYELALKCTGAVQAARWSRISNGEGYIYSFNGPHSLFADTIRSLRALAVSHQLGHVLMGERDARISLIERLIQHARTTSQFAVFFGEGRDYYDERGRVAHESVFNLNDGNYRCPNSQQGFSPFTTWTRGQAWIIAGYPEQLEWLATRPDAEFEPFGGRAAVEELFLKTALASCDHYIENTPTDGIPYWDTGAPFLHKLGDYMNQPAQIHNDWEPVDSSAAAIAAQGLLRLGRYLQQKGDARGDRYWQAGLTVADTVLAEPYLSTDANHQGLILHSIYHRPNGWDYIPEGSKIPLGESSMWGDYHARELAIYLQRIIENKPYYTFFSL